MKKDKDIFDRIMEWKILSIFNPFIRNIKKYYYIYSLEV